jgi:hypothetical protein
MEITLPASPTFDQVNELPADGSTLLCGLRTTWAHAPATEHYQAYALHLMWDIGTTPGTQSSNTYACAFSSDGVLLAADYSTYGGSTPYGYFGDYSPQKCTIILDPLQAFDSVDHLLPTSYNSTDGTVRYQNSNYSGGQFYTCWADIGGEVVASGAQQLGYMQRNYSSPEINQWLQFDQLGFYTYDSSTKSITLQTPISYGGSVFPLLSQSEIATALSPTYAIYDNDTFPESYEDGDTIPASELMGAAITFNDANAAVDQVWLSAQAFCGDITETIPLGGWDLSPFTFTDSGGLRTVDIPIGSFRFVMPQTVNPSCSVSVTAEYRFSDSSASPFVDTVGVFTLIGATPTALTGIWGLDVTPELSENAGFFETYLLHGTEVPGVGPVGIFPLLETTYQAMGYAWEAFFTPLPILGELDEYIAPAPLTTITPASTAFGIAVRTDLPLVDEGVVNYDKYPTAVYDVIAIVWRIGLLLTAIGAVFSLFISRHD